MYEFGGLRFIKIIRFISVQVRMKKYFHRKRKERPGKKVNSEGEICCESLNMSNKRKIMREKEKGKNTEEKNYERY